MYLQCFVIINFIFIILPVNFQLLFDRVMCAVQDKDSGRYYTRECRELTAVYVPEDDNGQTLYGSDDLIGQYTDVCPYFDTCAKAPRNGKCASDSTSGLSDNPFSFVGYVGRVVDYDDTPITPVVYVTFNNGRTSYGIEEDTLKLEYRKSGYEIWWVQRTRSKFSVQKRKGFNVTYPTCTFDTVNDR